MEKKEPNYFELLNAVKCTVDKKQSLSYISWAHAWKEVKKLHPDSTYIIYENNEGYPFWESSFGIDVKVGVTINGIEHIIRLPVMDGANKAMKAESYEYKTKYDTKTVQPATQFDINKAIMRAFAKAIAMHGIGLYVFIGEDLPEAIVEEVKAVTKKPVKKIAVKEAKKEEPVIEEESKQIFSKDHLTQLADAFNSMGIDGAKTYCDEIKDDVDMGPRTTYIKNFCIKIFDESQEIDSKAIDLILQMTADEERKGKFINK